VSLQKNDRHIIEALADNKSIFMEGEKDIKQEESKNQEKS
jgi:hypothetical protein